MLHTAEVYILTGGPNLTFPALRMSFCSFPLDAGSEVLCPTRAQNKTHHLEDAERPENPHRSALMKLGAEGCWRAQD